MSKKTGVNTSTIIHRFSLSKTNGKYGLSKDQRKETKSHNARVKQMKKYKAKCRSCKYIKDALFCLR